MASPKSAAPKAAPKARGDLHFLFLEMLRIRVVERRIAERYKEQEMRCPVHLSIGQEAVAVGVCAQLRKSDRAMSAHRSHGHYLAKGGNVRAMIAELYGRADGCCSGRAGSMHLMDQAAGFWGAVPIVGSTLPIAVGLALADKRKGRDSGTVAFLGEGATEEGVFPESLNLACVLKLPVLFICENNGFSVYTSLRWRRAAEFDFEKFVRSHGSHFFSGDGNDVEAVHHVAGEALNTLRADPRRGAITSTAGRGRMIIWVIARRSTSRIGRNATRLRLPARNWSPPIRPSKRNSMPRKRSSSRRLIPSLKRSAPAPGPTRRPCNEECSRHE